MSELLWLWGKDCLELTLVKNGVVIIWRAGEVPVQTDTWELELVWLWLWPRTTLLLGGLVVVVVPAP